MTPARPRDKTAAPDPARRPCSKARRG